MISPYLEAAAKRAEIIGNHAEYQRRDYYAPRTQREAGLEYAEWGERLKPLHSWVSDILAGVGIAVFIIAAVFLSSEIAAILH